MQTQRSPLRTLRLAVFAAAVVAGCVAGCETLPPAPPAAGADAPIGPAAEQTEVCAGGAEVWAQNCARCHNPRPLNQFSSTQWDLIAHHMRVRANLTAEEYRTIRAYLTAEHR
jgi:mono/diheme cytochrome c family protein